MKRILVSAIALTGLAACSSDSKSADTTAGRATTTEAAATTRRPTTTAAVTTTRASTSSAPRTTVAATTTSIPATTVAPTTAPPTTEAAVAGSTGLVWRSAVDPARVNTADGQPTADVDGVASRIDMVVVVPADAKGDLGDDCRDEIDLSNTPDASQCLMVQWSFDVADDFRVDNNSPQAGLSAGDVVTAERKQVSSIYASSGYPGTIDNYLSVYYPSAGAGTVVHWSTGSNLVGWTDHTYTVPDGELPPISFGG